MPQVRNIPAGEPYEQQPGEYLLQWVNSGEVPLYIGIRRGEYMIAAAAGAPQVQYVLNEEQWVRLQQQGQLQGTYQRWLSSGLLAFNVEPEPPDGPPWGPGGKPWKKTPAPPPVQAEPPAEEKPTWP